MIEEINENSIKNKIRTIRGFQVILDKDIAKLYKVQSRRLREQVKRNIERFPRTFMFQLTSKEVEFMVSQNATPSKKQLGGALPYVFTEQGVAMLAGILRSTTAIEVSIKIIETFVLMRKFIVTNTELFSKINLVERKQIKHELETNNKFNKIFKAIQQETPIKKQGIFFEGQIFEAYKFIINLIQKANTSIILIDNYIDENVLLMLNKRKKGVEVQIYTKLNSQIKLDLKKYNEQYEKITIKELKKSHDRFLIIDNTETYHIGASIKDAGKKWFAFSKLNQETLNIINKLNE